MDFITRDITSLQHSEGENSENLREIVKVESRISETSDESKLHPEGTCQRPENRSPESLAADSSVNEATREYTTETLGVGRINVDVENAIQEYEANGMDRRARQYIKTYQVKRTFKDCFQPAPSTTKRVSFGVTRVLPFEKTDIVPRRSLKAMTPKKSILKSRKDKFVTRNHDYEIVGKSQLLTAVGRIYNLCDLPLTIFDKNESVVALQLLARGVANAFKAKEMCWKHMTNKIMERKDRELGERDSQIEILEKKVRALAGELNELKQVPETVLAGNSVETLIVEDSKGGESERTVELMEVLEKDLRKKRMKEESLTAENSELKMEVEKLKNALLEQQNANEPLLCQVKALGESLEKERTKSTEFEKKMIALEKIRRESLELETKLQVAEKTNAKLIHNNENLCMWNDALYRKADDLEVSIGDLQSNLTFAQLSYKRLELTHEKTVKERDDYHKEIKSLRDINLANKSGSDLRIEQLKIKCDRLTEDCRIRDEQIRKSECELRYMDKLLLSSRGRMAKRKKETIIYFNAPPPVNEENPVDKWTSSQPEISLGKRIFKPLVNKVH